MDDYHWQDGPDGVDFEELAELYRVAPLGDMTAADLATVFGNSRYSCFVRHEGVLVGVGRALADGIDCAYIGHVAVHPDHRGRGLGAAVVRRLLELCRGHRKILLYANPGTEPFYRRLGFLPMTTAMAVWSDPDRGVAAGLLSQGERS